MFFPIVSFLINGLRLFSVFTIAVSIIPASTMKPMEEKYDVVVKNRTTTQWINRLKLHELPCNLIWIWIFCLLALRLFTSLGRHRALFVCSCVCVFKCVWVGVCMCLSLLMPFHHRLLVSILAHLSCTFTVFVLHKFYRILLKSR